MVALDHRAGARCAWCSFCGEELSALPAAELAVRLAEAYRLIGEQSAQIERLSARVEQLERQARRDSSTSSRPASADSPYKKKGRDRSLRERGERRPGKQAGDFTLAPDKLVIRGLGRAERSHGVVGPRRWGTGPAADSNGDSNSSSQPLPAATGYSA